MTSSLPFRAVLLAAVGFGALCASGGIAQAQFKQTDLVSDISGLAAITDPNLKNTWGVAAIPGASPFWIDNQGTSTSSLYSVTGSTGVAPVNLNGAPGTNFAAIPGVGPTGIVANSGTSFGIAGGPALFIFANLNGSISAWNGSNINSATNNASTVVARRALPTPDWPSTVLAPCSMPQTTRGPALSMSLAARSLRRPSLVILPIRTSPPDLSPSTWRT
jgi:hypothetical protein